MLLHGSVTGFLLILTPSAMELQFLRRHLGGSTPGRTPPWEAHLRLLTEVQVGKWPRGSLFLCSPQ